MLNVLYAALSLPTVIYTVLLGLSVVFWSMVLVGGTDPDSMDFDHDIAVDGDADVHVDHGDVDHGGDVSHGGFLSTIFGFLNVGSVPVSLISTVTVFASWTASMVGQLFLKPMVGDVVPGWTVSFAQFMASGMCGLLLAGLSTRQLRGLFQVHTVHGEDALVDQICTVVTSKVTADFGQAEVKTKGAPLLLDVRCSRENKLAKGAQAVIIAHDKEKDVYEIGELEPDQALASEELPASTTAGRPSGRIIRAKKPVSERNR